MLLKVKLQTEPRVYTMYSMLHLAGFQLLQLRVRDGIWGPTQRSVPLNFVYLTLL